MVLMREHRIDMVKLGDLQIVKAQHDPVAVRSKGDERPERTDVEADLFGPEH